MAKPSEREFTLHKNVFNLLVNNQAGSLTKGLLESVMNSVDAGSPIIEVTLTETQATVADKGKGFTNDDEIKQFFSTIGTPHTEGDAEFGRYRMGRAQNFRYGINTWRSNTFQMIVDARGLGQQHIKTTGLPQQDGCHITIDLYDPLSPAEVRTITSTLAEWVRWLAVPVWINGTLASQTPASAKWTIETDDARILLNESSEMLVYNKGIFVMSLGASVLGSGGIVTSKKAFDVIYARNAIQQTCPVWRGVKKAVTAATRPAIARRGLTEDQRAFLAQQLMAGQVDMHDPENLKLRLFTYVDGTHASLPEFAQHAYTGLGLAPQGDPLGTFVHRSNYFKVLATETLDRFGTTTLNQIADRLVDVLTQQERKRVLSRTLLGHRTRDDYIIDNEISHVTRRLGHTRVADIEHYRSLMHSTIVPIPSTSLPRHMRSYVTVLTKTVRELRIADTVILCLSKTVTGCLQQKTLMVDPRGLPDPRGGISALIQTAAKLLQIAEPATEEEFSHDVAIVKKLKQHYKGVDALATQLMTNLLKQDRAPSTPGAARALLCHDDMPAVLAAGDKLARAKQVDISHDGDNVDDAA